MTKTSKDELAKIAIDLFSRVGFNETTIGDIEAAAGLKPRAGGFYRHFESKQAVLFESIEDMSSVLVAEIRLEEILAQETVRGELLFIADRMLSHAAEFRTVRLLLQREAHKIPHLRDVMEAANQKLAKQDVIPWVLHALKRSGRDDEPVAFAFLFLSPILLYLISADRGQPVLGLEQNKAITIWLDYWAEKLEPV